MKLWIIALVLGVLAVSGVFLVSAINAKESNEVKIVDCENCNNGCSLEKNCGRNTCSFVSENKKCGCGR